MKVITNRHIKYEQHSNFDKAAAQKTLGGIGLAGATAAIGAIASRAGVAKTGLAADVKAACGRKPLLGKQRKATYAKCVSDFTNNNNAPVNNGPTNQYSPPAPTGMSMPMKIGIAVGGVIVLGIIIALVVKHNKKKK